MRWQKSGILGTMATIALGTSTALGWPSRSEAVENVSSETLARAVLDPDASVRDRASAELRRRGPGGHSALMRVHADAIAGLRESGERANGTDRLRRAIDRVSAQRDGHASGLYWFTDLERAQDEARRTGLPILSLRMLGRLDEELSCANSRFFRVVLYSDPQVAQRLSRQFVLHWSSERPAPRITIDMGDGRQLVRTITGNSAHYVLDAEGRPIDVLVGLYAPRAFLGALDEAQQMHEQCGRLEADAQSECLARLHGQATIAFAQRWDERFERDSSMGHLGDVIATMNASLPEGARIVPAPIAMRMTVSKMVVEQPMLELIVDDPAPRTAVEPAWDRIGILLYGADPISSRSLALLRLKSGERNLARRSGDLMSDALADSVRNEILFHRRIHALFEQRDARTADFAALNAHVYSDLMLTPASDPWLGLAPDENWDAIER